MVQLTQAQIQKNKDIFLLLNKKYQILPELLITFLGEEFFHAPATTMTSMHNACDGGLLDYLLKVAEYAKKLNDILPSSLQQPALSVYRVAFLSGIGKTHMFVPNQNEWSRKNGKIYEFASNVAAMSAGERSALYAMRYMVLSDEEYQAILNSDRSEEEPQVKWFGSPLTTILRQAIEWAIMDIKHRE
jgi:23S rRNA maturation-related 3'-5' exoribonuclease YhaM